MSSVFYALSRALCFIYLVRRSLFTKGMEATNQTTLETHKRIVVGGGGVCGCCWVVFGVFFNPFTSAGNRVISGPGRGMRCCCAIEAETFLEIFYTGSSVAVRGACLIFMDGTTRRLVCFSKFPKGVLTV